MSRHYIPVAGKRWALSIYRQRRQVGDGPFGSGPLNPTDAMRSTIHFFSGHLAMRVSHDNAIPKDLLDGLRAAEHYKELLSKKPWRDQPLGKAWLDQPEGLVEDRLAQQHRPAPAPQGCWVSGAKKAYQIPDAVAASGISEDIIRAAIVGGKLPARKPGKAYLILDDDLEEWLHNLPIVN